MKDFNEEQILDSSYHEEDNPWANLQYASFFQRAGASLIDVLVLLPIILAYFFFVGDFETSSVSLFLFSLIYPLYKIVMEAQYGATLGKMALQLRIVDQGAGSIDMTQALKRYTIYGLSILFSFLILIDQVLGMGMSNALLTIEPLFNLLTLVSVLFVAFDPAKQAIHDKIADTYVVLNNGRSYGGGF